MDRVLDGGKLYKENVTGILENSLAVCRILSRIRGFRGWSFEINKSKEVV